MGKQIVIEDPIITGVRFIHKYGVKSLAVTIPKSAITFLKLKKGDKLVISVDIKNEKILLEKPKHIEDKISDGSYTLGIPKDLYEKLIKE
jgi:antitoxin component of MazEF toxin-antitoxin module